MSAGLADRIADRDIARLAGRVPLAADPAPLMVSVDFDFFVEVGVPEGLSAAASELARRALSVCGDERLDAPSALARWAQRAALARQAGLWPSQLMGMSGAPAPARLLRALSALERPGALAIADSHAFGAVVLRALCDAAGGPVEVLSFDAHHDLGYLNTDDDTPARSRARTDAGAGCDDWIAWGMRRGLVRSATVVYPDWQGLWELEAEPPTARPQELSRVRFASFSDWLAGERPARAGAVVAVRSSEWTPPWDGYDAAFCDLVGRLAPARVCLDCAAAELGAGVGAFDACRPRPWPAQQKAVRGPGAPLASAA